MTPQALAALHARCFVTPRPWSDTEFAALLDTSFLLTAPDAFLLGRVVADEAEVLTLATAPEARKQGIARGLVRRFEAEAQARGAADAFLEVSADNLAARALYEGAGFAEVGLRKSYYQTPDLGKVDAVVMRKALG